MSENFRMPEVSVQEKKCDKCGAEVRPETQFCYNCGKSVGSEAIPSPSEASPNASGPLAGSTSSAIEPSNGQYAPVGSGPNLTSAASLRRKGRAIERKAVEVVWEPSGNRANLPLVISTIVFTIFTIIMILMALASR